MKAIKSYLPGIGMAVLLAIPAWLLGERFPIVGSPVLGILFGMLLAFWKRPAYLQPGLGFTSKKILQYSIILLGFGMNLFVIFEVGAQTLTLMLFTLTATFLAAYVLGRLLKIERNTNILIGVGTAICGGSAIAATAPVIRAKDDEVARAISTIFFFNVLAAFLFPPLGHLLGLNAQDFGLWAGTAINDTSSVVAAAYTYGDVSGDLAVIVKLTRTLLIIPVTLVLALLGARQEARAVQQGEAKQEKYRLRAIFPWFVLGFVAASVISTFLPLPAIVIDFFSQAGKFMIVMAMAAIGLGTNIVSLVKNGLRPILLGFGCWVVLAITSLVVQNFL